jgi:hypothetical protein
MRRGLIRLAEDGLIPDEIVRLGIGLLNWKRPLPVTKEFRIFALDRCLH